MNFFLLGRGKVGSAILKHFDKKNLPLFEFNIEKTPKNSKGTLFLAVPDEKISQLTKEISTKFPNLSVIHFSAASDTEDMHLLHPYCSIGKETDLSDITFTLWSKNREVFENIIHFAKINFVYAGITPSALYHISAVLSGNFSQFFTTAALELLKKEGFTEENALKLIDQLILSSIKNISHGTEGISGPASRGDDRTIKKEALEIKPLDPELSEIFTQINRMIKNAVKNGTVFKK